MDLPEPERPLMRTSCMAKHCIGTAYICLPIRRHDYRSLRYGTSAGRAAETTPPAAYHLFRRLRSTFCGIQRHHPRPGRTPRCDQRIAFLASPGVSATLRRQRFHGQRPSDSATSRPRRAAPVRRYQQRNEGARRTDVAASSRNVAQRPRGRERAAEGDGSAGSAAAARTAAPSRLPNAMQSWHDDQQDGDQRQQRAHGFWQASRE